MPIGGTPSIEENRKLARALKSYAERKSPDDFKSLTDFLGQHPNSAWNAALLLDLGIEYYNTAHYSLALDAFKGAWSHAKEVRDAQTYRLLNRAGTELACLYARLGRMEEAEGVLHSADGKAVLSGNNGKLGNVREALWTMHNRPEVAFRCGPLALHRIQLATDPEHAATAVIHQSASTQQGFSLPQVAELSRKIGMNYQMAFREKGGEFVVPSVVHWKVGHYAAMLRQEGDRYLLEDPTFGNSVWATSQALEEETSGYFLIPADRLPAVRWRSVGKEEGGRVWGKGQVTGYDNDASTCRDPQTSPCGTLQSCLPRSEGQPMAVSSVHLMSANLQIRDTPLGYRPPVGPAVRLTVRYNSRAVAGGTANANFGAGCGCDWFANITDNPQSPLADVIYAPGGGGGRRFSGFDTNTQTFAVQQYDQTLLKRTGTNSYELLWPDGSKQIFAQTNGSVGSSRQLFLSQVQDPQGNAFTLTYDANFVVVAISDAIGQVTSITYGWTNTVSTNYFDPTDAYKITKVTDPFGRFARFDYGVVLIGYQPDPQNPNNKIPVYGTGLIKITDMLGINSQMGYDSTEPVQVNFLTTPYGTTSFTIGQVTNSAGVVRFAETHFPDGSRERVEFNQGTNVYTSDPPGTVPTGMSTVNNSLQFRNTYYWTRDACATAYGDYRKARVYHWLHMPDLNTASGILESIKQPLENRVWYDYPGQGSSVFVGSLNRPAHIGRVLDDGSTQLHSYRYNSLGRMTNMIDPLGRSVSFLYDTNGIDLLEVRQTRSATNELLVRKIYNQQHRPVAIIDAGGRTNSIVYNSRGQPLTSTNRKGETTSFTYDTNGYLLAVDGPLPGTNDTIRATYDALGRRRTFTDVNGYVLTFDYDGADRLTKVTCPDGTYMQYTYDRLHLASYRDRAGRVTSFGHDNMRQLTRITDPLGRTNLLDWCRCGGLRSLTDAMGRKTSWLTDVQGRVAAKQYPDGSQTRYFYEKATSRVRQFIDEKFQGTQFTYNRENTLNTVIYINAGVPTHWVAYAYDPNYERLTSLTDGTGTRIFSYVPITGGTNVGAGRLASVDGPLPNDTITYTYDELGRPVHRSINGVGSAVTYDAAGRATAVSNALGSFTRSFDGGSRRVLTESYPNGQSSTRTYGTVQQDISLQSIAWAIGATPIWDFSYEHDLTRGLITQWSQQAGASSPDVYSFTYDAVNQLIGATVTNSGSQINSFAYSYDPAANRLTEQVGSMLNTATYNALNEITTSTAPGSTRGNEWDAAHRLVAVNSGNQRTEFAYDAQHRLSRIRLLVNGSEVSHRLFLWDGSRLREERDTNGVVTKRFFPQGFRLETGANAGNYYYVRDHLHSIRALTDQSGAIRARYAYDPFGRRTKLSGEVDADFGFAGMFWCAEAGLALTRFRAYDPELGRWLSRDPLKNAEKTQGPNLYAYVNNEPVDRIDPEGLCTGSSICSCFNNPAATAACAEAGIIATGGAEGAVIVGENAPQVESAVAPLVEECAAIAEQTAIRFETAITGGIGSAPTIEAEGMAYAETVRLDPALANTLLSEATEAEWAAQHAEWEWAHQFLVRELELTRDFRQSLPWDQQKLAFQEALARFDGLLRMLNSQR